MKYLITLFLILILGISGQTQNQEIQQPEKKTQTEVLDSNTLKITLRYFAGSQLDAEIGVVQLGAKIHKQAEQLSLSSEEKITEDGQKFWIGTFVIQITTDQLRERLREKHEEAMKELQDKIKQDSVKI